MPAYKVSTLAALAIVALASTQCADAAPFFGLDFSKSISIGGGLPIHEKSIVIGQPAHVTRVNRYERQHYRRMEDHDDDNDDDNDNDNGYGHQDHDNDDNDDDNDNGYGQQDHDNDDGHDDHDDNDHDDNDDHDHDDNGNDYVKQDHDNNEGHQQYSPEHVNAQYSANYDASHQTKANGALGMNLSFGMAALGVLAAAINFL